MAANGSHGDKSQLPLAGVILCCTSILPERRSELSTIAAEMGAASKLDLTSDVTHLIVGDIDTPKYKYVAKERPDVVCLSPDWVYAVREAWMEGGELDIESYEQRYKCPTFMGLRICVTGFEDLIFRKQIEEIAKANGADYKGDLSKETTHLIARVPSGAKYTHGKIWGVKVVTIEWFQQSLERGMVLDESLYDPLLEESARGRGAWIRRSDSGSSLGKRRRTEDVIPMPGRMLRRSASSRYDSQNDGFWSDITTSVPRPQPKSVSEWEENNAGQTTVQTDTTTTQSKPDQNAPQSPKPQSLSKPRGMFHGKKFYLHGFDSKQNPVLQQCLASHDAELVCDYSEETQQSTLSTDSYLVIPHNSAPSDRPSTQGTSFSSTVTEFWVEKCLYKKETVDPVADMLSNPFQFPIPGFQDLVITSTAFEGIELLHLNKAIKLLGATYDEFLARKVSVLICNEGSVNREKIKAALEWRIPAVKAQWLWDSMQSGQMKDVYNYLVYPKAQQRSDIEKRQEASNVVGLAVESDPPAKLGSNKIKGTENDSRQEPTTSRREPSVSHGPFAQDDDSPGSAAPDQKLPSPSKQSNTSKFETRSRPSPLKERSPNSPTAPQVSPSKSDKPSAHVRSKSDRDALSDAITSLLAQTKTPIPLSAPDKPSTNTRPLSNPSAPETRRRNRKLLGRATSNLSNRSIGSNNPVLNLNTGLSRASSVGTMNTDDVGTPLDLSAAGPGTATATETSTSKTALGDGLTTSALTSHDELLAAEDDGEDPEEKPLQMTQVGYEDPEAGRWRARLMRKVSAHARGVKDGEVVDGDKKKTKGELGGAVVAGGGGTLEDEGEGARSVSTRTRRRTRGGAGEEEVVGIEWE